MADDKLTKSERVTGTENPYYKSQRQKEDVQPKGGRNAT
jgi:hypothetical protein